MHNNIVKTNRGYDIFGSDYDLNYFNVSEIQTRDSFWKVKKDDVVIDIGSHFGIYTLDSLQAGARVFSFEPNKDSFFKLCTNVRINNFSSRCELVNMGILHISGVVDFYNNNGNDSAIVYTDQNSTYEVLVETLDKFLSSYNLEHIDWIKIDVEGAEAFVIKGMVDTLINYSPNVFVENHTCFNPSIEDEVRSLMNDIGYKDYIIFKQHLYGTNNIYKKEKK